MSEFKVKPCLDLYDNYFIGRGTEDYMHRDGEIVHGSVEHFPTEEQAQAVLDKFQPEHVWVHGDVFRRESTGTVMMVLKPSCVERSVFCVDHQPYAVGSLSCLNDATFLFNIKDKL